MYQFDMLNPTVEPSLKQQLFNKSVDGLAKQDFHQSMNYSRRYGTGCAYRGENGYKCALGHLIPDSDYQPDWEQNIPGSVRENGRRIVAACGLNPDSYEDVRWLQALQQCHDKGHDRQLMLDRLADFARIEKLVFPKLP